MKCLFFAMLLFLAVFGLVSPAFAQRTQVSLVSLSAVGIAANPVINDGYAVAFNTGRVYTHNMPNYGEVHGSLNGSIVAIAMTPDGKGYYLAASDGGVFAFGDASFYGSAVQYHLTAPVTAMATTENDNGYWLLTANGSVYAFGQAPYDGNLLHVENQAPDVAINNLGAISGYMITDADGNSTVLMHEKGGGQVNMYQLNGPIVGVTLDNSSKVGYWLATAKGQIVSYDNAPNWGSLVGDFPTAVVGISADRDGDGLMLVDTLGDVGFVGPGLADK
jgi:hypothetical protein